MDKLESFFEAIKWLAAGGSVIVISWIVSWGLEGVEFWHNLSSKIRAIIILLLALGLGWLAQYILLLPPEEFAKIEPYGQVLLLSLGAWLSMQGFHFLDKKRRDEIKPRGSGGSGALDR